MDQQRVQAYATLVEQLMWCDSEEVLKLLQQQGQFVDAGLLKVIDSEIEQLQRRGNAKAVQRLQHFQQIAAGLVAKEQTAIGVGQAQEEVSAGSLKNSEQFLYEVLQLVAKSQGDAQQVYPFLAQHQDKLNETLLQIFPDVVSQLLVGKQQQSVAADLGNFGNLMNHFPLGSRWLNLELSIVAYQSALQVFTREASPIHWAAAQNNLAAAYSNRILGERAENIEQAIAAYQNARQVYTREAFPKQWADTQHNLAIAYNTRIRGDRAENIEQAINIFKSALEVRTREAFPEGWAATQNSLANAYRDCLEGDRAENIEQAITSYRNALQVYTREVFPEQWAGTQNNLAIAYRDRIRGDRAENLEQAITTYQNALHIFTREAFPEKWAGIQHNLATLFWSRIRGNRAENIEQAIDIFKSALEVRTREAFSEDWAVTQNNLANAYRDRIWGNSAENIEEAITAFQNALEVRTREAFPEDWAATQNNLANAYRDRVKGEQAKNLEQAIAAYENALQVYTCQTFPNHCRGTARDLGDLYFEQQNWASAAEAYTIAIRAVEVLYRSCILLESKTTELRQTNDLPRRAAYALARSGGLEAAALALEQGRARGLSETLDRDRSDLRQLQNSHPDLFAQYQDIVQQLRNLETQERSRMTSEERNNLTPEAFRTTALQLRKALTETIEQVRQVEGFTNFLSQPDSDDIQQAVRPGTPLVYLVSTPAGSLALIVTQTGTADLWLDELNEADLINLLNTWFNAYNQSQTNHQGWLEAIDQVTHQLWQPLMAPLIDYLKRHSFQQVTLIPTGYLSFLPLHAAWTEDPKTPAKRSYALDEICFTYAPNARSINAAAAIAQRTRADSILAIDNPLQDLPNSSHEVTATIASFPQHKVLKHEGATIESVLAALPHCNVLHLSCHGTANLREPLTSGLVLNDKLLTLRDLLDLRLSEQGGIRLAVLSACETGLTGIELADEAIGLTTGLLQAGVAGVVASLWAVSDFSTMLLLVRFYDFWRKDGINSSKALRQAQAWVRDTTNRQKYDYLKSKVSSPLSSQADSGITAGFLNEFMLNHVYPSGWEARDFAHPFHWAAFTYTGV